MAALLQIIPQLLAGRKTYGTAALFILLGVGMLTGEVNPDTITAQPVTFENVDKALSEQPAPASGNTGTLGLLSILMGLQGMSTRAAIGKVESRD